MHQTNLFDLGVIIFSAGVDKQIPPPDFHLPPPPPPTPLPSFTLLHQCKYKILHSERERER